MDLHEEIAKMAYGLYEKNGRVAGRDLDNWLEAERIIKSDLTAATKKRTKASEPPQKSSARRHITEKAGKM